MSPTGESESIVVSARGSVRCTYLRERDTHTQANRILFSLKEDGNPAVYPTWINLEDIILETQRDK